MLYATLYVLVAVVIAQLVLVSYAFENVDNPVFPDYRTVAKSLGLSLIWPALLVFRLFVRADERFELLARIDLTLPEKAKWNPAPNLLGVARQVAVGAVADVASKVSKPAVKAKK